MLGKYTDIVSDMKEYEDVDLSFVDPAEKKNSEKTEQEPKAPTSFLEGGKEIKVKKAANGNYIIHVFNDKGEKIDYSKYPHAAPSSLYIWLGGDLSEKVNSSEITETDPTAKDYSQWVTFTIPNGKTEPEATSQSEKPFEIEEFWPESLNFMSPYEIDYVKKSIKDAIAAGKNANTWLSGFEMYGNKAEVAFSPESQKELKKVFDVEAKKNKAPNRLKIADAEDYFQKAIKNDPNYGWKEIVDINADWSEQLVDALFKYGQNTKGNPEFFSLPQTISVIERVYTAYTPNKNGDIFILYGNYNNSGEGMNYNWTGAAQFKTANRTQEEVIAELAEWLKGEVDYYDPQI